MIFKITGSNNKETLIRAESWLDLLHSLSNDVVKIERIEADKESKEMINKFIDQQNMTLATEYDAGIVCRDDDGFMIGYEMKGASETFSIGQPVYDKNGNLLGYLGIGLFDHLNYSANTRIPVEYWKICLPTKHCVIGKKVYTYWQNADKE